MDESETVTVPCWALAFVMDNADFLDDGPLGEGWKKPGNEACYGGYGGGAHCWPITTYNLLINTTQTPLRLRDPTIRPAMRPRPR